MANSKKKGVFLNFQLVSKYLSKHPGGVTGTELYHYLVSKKIIYPGTDISDVITSLERRGWITHGRIGDIVRLAPYSEGIC